MNIFNSLGSNYDREYVLRSVLKKDDNAKINLILYLEGRYKGQVQLVYKGRQALTNALVSLNLPKGSKVCVNAFTCIAVVDGIEEAGHEACYVDIDSETLNFTPQALEEKLKHEDIRVVIIQNTLGYPCDIEGIRKVCEKHKLILIEDLAHSIGTIYENGKEAGTVGDFVTLSFGQDKVVDAVSGGAVICRNPKYKLKFTSGSNVVSKRDKIYPLLTFYIRKTYPIFIGKILHRIAKMLGLLTNPIKPSTQKSISDWHAMLALDDFKRLDMNLAHRREIAEIYCSELDKKVLSKYVKQVVKNATHLRFPIFLENRDDLVEEFRQHKMFLSSIWYTNPIVPIKLMGLAKYPKNLTPISDVLMLNIINLPTHINVSKNDARQIAKVVNNFMKRQ